MNYPIPPPRAAITDDPRSVIGLMPSMEASPAVDENTLVEALQVVILSARAQGQTLADVTAEVLADDHLLSANQRQLLSEVVAKAWEQMPEGRAELATVTPISAESRRSTSDRPSVLDHRLAG
jgi:hypothetical protein